MDAVERSNAPENAKNVSMSSSDIVDDVSLDQYHGTCRIGPTGHCMLSWPRNIQLELTRRTNKLFVCMFVLYAVWRLVTRIARFQDAANGGHGSMSPSFWHDRQDFKTGHFATLDQDLYLPVG